MAEETKLDPEVRARAAANSQDNFLSGWLSEKIKGAFVDRMEKNEDIATRYFSDAAFRKAVDELIGKKVYEELRSHAAPAP